MYFSVVTTFSESFQFVFILLLLTVKCKRLLNELPAHGAPLEIPHTAVAQARVPAGQQHPVHGPVLANNAVLAALLRRLYVTFRKSSLFQQAAVCAFTVWRGIAGRSSIIICRHEKLLEKIKETSLKMITNVNYSSEGHKRCSKFMS